MILSPLPFPCHGIEVLWRCVTVTDGLIMGAVGCLMWLAVSGEAWDLIESAAQAVALLVLVAYLVAVPFYSITVPDQAAIVALIVRVLGQERDQE